MMGYAGMGQALTCVWLRERRRQRRLDVLCYIGAGIGYALALGLALL